MMMVVGGGGGGVLLLYNALLQPSRTLLYFRVLHIITT